MRSKHISVIQSLTKLNARWMNTEAQKLRFIRPKGPNNIVKM